MSLIPFNISEWVFERARKAESSTPLIEEYFRNHQGSGPELPRSAVYDAILSDLLETQKEHSKTLRTHWAFCGTLYHSLGRHIAESRKELDEERAKRRELENQLILQKTAFTDMLIADRKAIIRALEADKREILAEFERLSMCPKCSTPLVDPCESDCESHELSE